MILKNTSNNNIQQYNDKCLYTYIYYIYGKYNMSPNYVGWSINQAYCRYNYYKQQFSYLKTNLPILGAPPCII